MIFTPDEQAELFEIVEGLAEQCFVCTWLKHSPNCNGCHCGKAKRLRDRINERRENGTQMPTVHSNGDEPLEH